MDPVTEIKARLPIDELVRQYCQLQKKGRNFVCLCPFHNDAHPSFLVSPDKGIAYCFACQNGGDIFSFYQKIENVDFAQALRELAERTGVTLPERATTAAKAAKDERERLQDCLEEAVRWYHRTLADHAETRAYLEKRGVDAAQCATFELGMAPDAPSTLYEHLLKADCSRNDILAAGLAMQRDLAEARPLDRFRNRLMFPIRDLQGRLIGFGGRTLGSDHAKYINSAETALYRKSEVLYGIHLAREEMRKTKRAIIVEGYFDVLACHRVGATNAVAACGTALTVDHAKILRRSVDAVVLCFDADAAGSAAGDRAFIVLAAQGLDVLGVHTGAKDPADAAQEDPDALRHLLREGSVPYIELVIERLQAGDVSSAAGKRAAMQRLLPLLAAVPSAVERSHFAAKTAALLGSTDTAVEDDVQRYVMGNRSQHHPEAPAPAPAHSLFSAAEITLGFFLCFPKLQSLLPELIPPEKGMAAALYAALRDREPGPLVDLETLDLPEEHRQRVRLLHLFCEEHAFVDISESMATREIRKNCRIANRDVLRERVRSIAADLRSAAQEGRAEDRARLQAQFEEVLKLARMAE